LNDGDRSDGMLVGVINETFAKRFFSGQDPTAKRMRFYWGPDGRSPWVQIVGVVADSKVNSLAEEPKPEIFEVAGQLPQLFGNPAATIRVLSVLIRFNSPAMLTPSQLREAMKPLDPQLSVFTIEALDKIVASTLARPRFNATLLSVFAGSAFLLAIVGIYGLVSYSVSQRRREIGIRMALGAQRASILKLIVGQGTLLAVLGIGLGLAGSVALTRVIRSLLYGITSTDITTFVAVTLLLMGVAVLASYLPARRAAKISPLLALRTD
jgi:putative ABC transport system permease protein